MVTDPQTHTNNLLTIVIPAYNEAESLPVVLPELVELCLRRGWQLVVVDDGSTDATPQVLQDVQQALGVSPTVMRSIRHKLNRGYGGALKSGLSSTNSRYVVTFDADGQHKVSDIEQMLAFMQENDADLVVGWRPGKEGSLYRRTGKAVIRAVTLFLVPNSIHDLNSGFKMFRTGLVQAYLQLCPDSMAFSDIITLVFIRRRHLVLNFPVQTGGRITGRSTINTYTALETLVEVLNIIMLFNPLRIFLSVAFVCLAFGVLWGIPILLRGRGVSVGSMLAIVTGLIFVFLGLVAEQLSQMRLQGIQPPQFSPGENPPQADPPREPPSQDQDPH